MNAGCLSHLIGVSKCKYRNQCELYQPRPCDTNPEAYCDRYKTFEYGKVKGAK